MITTTSRARRNRRAPLALALATTAATAIALPATAVPALAADPGWQAAATLTTADKDANDPRVVRALDGSATAVWVRSGDDALGATVVQASSRPLGGAWSAPQTISLGADQSVADIRVAVGADGSVAAGWSQRAADRSTRWAGRIALKRPGAGWSAATPLTTSADETSSPSLTIAPDGTVTAAWSRVDGTDSLSHVEVAHTTAGGWSAPDAITASPDADEPKLARGADGTLGLTWLDYDTTTNNYTVWGAVAPTGGAWDPRHQVSDSTRYSYGNPQVVVGPTGETTIVFQSRTNNVRYSRYQALSASWSASAGWSATAEEISANDRTVNAQDPNVGIDSDGNVTAAFLKTDYNGDDAAGVTAVVDHVQVATRAAGTRSWSTPATIADETPNATLRKVNVTVGGNGAATVAWAGYETSAKRAKIVRVARREAGTTSWSAPLDLSAPGGTASTQLPWTIGLAADAYGATSVVWHINDSAGVTQIQAADYEVERPAPAPDPDPTPIDPTPQPAPQPQPPVQPAAPAPAQPGVEQWSDKTARGVAATPKPKLQLTWRGQRLVVRVNNAPKGTRLRVTVGSGRKARTFAQRGVALTLPAKQSTPRGRVVVRLLNAQGKTLASFATRAPKQPLKKHAAAKKTTR
ncbi:hypothetical protein Q5424_11270 [Conexibacter sp. JD483]|uniref:hypothetical protein n=1 Tax=unclassified Conexibacter TaxID=2627773 RepID=UPI0027231FAF|nr:MULTISPECIES: hypothetical protein [unclassified Conexibacter]MDO8187924.1 hypothetical protein [Conexibacter sp. CPCC 205706]MDO8198625.1 hypothetical protein [Conexibacter sp. CPCC 205762]MDR9369665.1 hypothetical protein [Conexibacter sp. JD483]